MVKNNNNNNNNNTQQLDEKPIANGHALQNGNGSTVGVAAPPTAVDVSWRQYLWNSWDAFADVMWFIICSIGFILQVRFRARCVIDSCELMSFWSCSMSCFVCCVFFGGLLFIVFITPKALESCFIHVNSFKLFDFLSVFIFRVELTI